jgi:hypothetical protein
MIGTGKGTRSNAAWKQVYRSLEHGSAKNACTNQSMMKKFPKAIEDFGNKFVEMQFKRHNADYDPGGRFYKSAVLQDIADALTVITTFQKESASHRRAFAALVLFRNRG